MELVSVIMPSYNASLYLEEAVKSVVNQSYKNLELLIVDDCSTDDSRRVIDKLVKEYSMIIPIFLENNSGAAIARNTGIENARGRYIAFLDADDVWLPSKIELQIQFMEKYKLSFSYTNYDFIDTNGEVLRSEKKFRTTLTYPDMLKSNFIGCLTAVYDAKKLGKVFMPLIRKRQDYGLWLEILKTIDFARGIKKPLALYRFDNNSISSNKLEMLYWNWQLFYHVQKLGLFKSIRSLFYNIYYKIVD